MKTTHFGRNGRTPARLGDLSGHTYMITGADAGAGFATTEILLRKKARVVMSSDLPECFNRQLSRHTTNVRLRLYLIDAAKNILLEPGKTIAEVAYALGFEYPQYTSGQQIEPLTAAKPIRKACATRAF